MDGWVSPEAIETLERVEETFQCSSPVALVLECDDFFQPDRIHALHDTVEALRQLSELKHLTWIGDISQVNLRRQETFLLPAADDEMTAETLEASREALINQPLCRENLISLDGRTILMLIDVESTDALEPIEQTAAKCLRDTNIQHRMTGIMVLREVEERILHEDNLRIQGLAYLLVGVTAFVMFRRPAAMLIAGGGPVTGMVWSIGWLQLLGQSGNALAVIILPVLVAMIGYTDSVHLVIRIRQLKTGETSIRDAVFEAVRTVGPACFLTSLTTAIGFGSLMLSQSEMIAGFGRAAAIGVSVTFFAVILVTSLLAMTPFGSHIHMDQNEDPSGRLINRLTGVLDLSCRYPVFVTSAGIILTLVCVSVGMQLVPEDRLSARIPNDCAASEAMRHCDREVGGIRSIYVVLEWQEEVTRAEVWAAVRDCEEAFNSEDIIGPVNSIRTALTVYRGPAPEDRHVLVNRLPDELRNRFYNSDRRQTLVTARTRDVGVTSFRLVAERIEDKLADITNEHSGIRAEFVSDIMIEADIVRQIIAELMASLASATVIIIGILMIAFRSFRIGLASIIPNIMPLAIAAALRYLVDESLDVATACSFAICLGIAVDDTIHFLTHYRHERSRGFDKVEANRRTFVAVGSAMFVTTLVMTSGLATVMTSRLPPQVNFAAMGCVTLAAALPADLIFLPALLCLLSKEKSAISSTNEERPTAE